MSVFTDAFDGYVDQALNWLMDGAGGGFDVVRAVLEDLFNLTDGLLHAAPSWIVIGALTILGWLLVSRAHALFTLIGLWLCSAMGLWTDTMSTVSLVLTCTILALLVGIPLGIFVGLTSGLTKTTDAILDFIQTMPPYIYLLPGIALLGYGPGTAMAATTLVAIPPALRLTAHGIRMTPVSFRELGSSVGMQPWEVLIKIRIPLASPAILAGVNQSLMLAFGMVVIAGIVGSGGLGQTVYEAVRTLKIDQSINAGIAIVIVTIVLDRLPHRLGKASEVVR
jgi:glycine betaine/proline transport system permease protein